MVRTQHMDSDGWIASMPRSKVDTKRCRKEVENGGSVWFHVPSVGACAGNIAIGRRCRNKGNDLMGMSIHTKLTLLQRALDNWKAEAPETSSCVGPMEKVPMTGSNKNHA